MTCNACGEKPKDTAKDFTKAVIEINNPETLVLLRKVVIPASMGTEEDVPAAIGKYHNVILHYEANRHTYLYSSDGIPTLLEMEVPQEVWDSIDELQEEIDEIKNSPDVVDIVDTYADLESYDTSELGDKDVIRVLNDETHDGESTYYRWNLSSQTWTFIGGLGPYYTKDETDALIESAKKTWVGEETTSSSSGTTAEITTTAGDFEWAEGHTVVVNFKYKAGRSALDIDSTGAYNIDNVRSLAGGIDSGVAIQYVCAYVGGQRGYRPIGRLRASSDVAGPLFIADNLTTTGSVLTALSANQGKALNDKIIDNVGKAKVLTADDYNWNSTSHSSVEPYDSVALWLLAPGMYIFENGVSGYVGKRISDNVWIRTNDKKLYQVSPLGTYGVLIVAWEINISTGGSPMEVARTYSITISDGSIPRSGYLGAPIDNLSSSNADVPLSARQGKILNDTIGDLSALTTNQKGSIVNAINEINREGDYSDTIELDTETKWTNGDKIYKRTIQVAALPNNGSSTYSFGVPSTTLGQVVKFEIIAHNQNTSTFIQVPDGIGISAKVETGGVRVDTTSDYSGYSAYITVWYTKNS